MAGAGLDIDMCLGEGISVAENNKYHLIKRELSLNMVSQQKVNAPLF